MFYMTKESALAAASTCLFVLLWSSGAIFSKWGLAHASPFAFLLIRFAIALMALVLIIPLMKFQMPRGARAISYAMATGVVLLAAYQIFYLLALELKVTPGVMATVMGVQPILTAVIMERKHSLSRSGWPGWFWWCTRTSVWRVCRGPGCCLPCWPLPA